MTRWARAKSVHQHCKQPEEPTPWSEFLSQKNEANKKLLNRGTNKAKSNSAVKKKFISKEEKSLKLLKKKKCVESPENVQIEANKILLNHGANKAKSNSAEKKKFISREEKSLKSLKKKKCVESPENVQIELHEHNSKSKNKMKMKKKLKKNMKNKNMKTFSNEFTTESVEDKDEFNQDTQITPPAKDEEKKLLKKNKRKQLQELRKMKRQLNGITLLPEKIENKIYKLKVMLRKKGVSGERIKEIVRKERRKQEIKYKKETIKNKQVCFHCREPGHQIAKCPALLNDTEQGTGICFKCGSTEHKVNECSAKITDFPFAKCFICKKQGHLSRSCPDNQKGLYPNGGCCKQCGKLDHLKKDCPELKEMEGVSEMLLPTMKTSVSADAEIDEYFQEKKHRHKVIKF